MDARLIAGLAIIALSILLGNAIVGAGDERVTVWAASHDLAAGARISGADVLPVEVVLPEEQAAGYFRDEMGEPEGRLAAPLMAGQLVPVSAISGKSAAALLVAVPVEADRLPLEIGSGTRVDVWTSPRDGAPGPARLVRRGVLVHDVAPLDETTGETRTVVLEVPADAASEAGELIEATRSGALDLVMADQR